MSGFVGLETFFSSIEVHSKADVIVAAIHWSLILAGFRYKHDSATQPTEMLPKRWNHDQDHYTLKYIQGNNTNDVYTVKVIRVDNALIVNILNSKDDSVKSASVNVDSHINDDITNFRAYKDPKALYDFLTSNLMQQLQPKYQTSTDNTQDPGPSDRQVDERPSRSLPEYIDPLSVATPRRDYEDDPISIGRGDLDPLGRYTAGGMLMDPRSLFRPFRQDGPRFGLPRGAVPPGARFDPFGPPNVGYPGPDRNRFAMPNPDHLPPPGYDDMFG